MVHIENGEKYGAMVAALRSRGIELTSTANYWVSKGLIPLETAQKICASPLAAQIRAGGDCEGRNPETWAEWYKDGVAVMPNAEKPSARAAEAIWVDNPEEVADGRFVMTYHIDSWDALVAFHDTICTTAGK